jgi:hypothetical protein
MRRHEDLTRLAGLEVYAESVSQAEGVEYFLGRRGAEKLVASIGAGEITGEKIGELDGTPLIVGAAVHRPHCQRRSGRSTWAGHAGARPRDPRQRPGRGAGTAVDPGDDAHAAQPR